MDDFKIEKSNDQILSQIDIFLSSINLVAQKEIEGIVKDAENLKNALKQHYKQQ
jgi:hypothetical protein